MCVYGEERQRERERVRVKVRKGERRRARESERERKRKYARPLVVRRCVHAPTMVRQHQKSGPVTKSKQ